jgi:D-tyrosyl-tRNA(Tyr) deacylase
VRALLQRVSKASVSVAGEISGEIERGLVVLLGIARGDSEEDARYLADKIVNLRIFSDEQGRFNLSALDTKGDLLIVSQFTLLANARKGRRPSFAEAAPPTEAEALFQRFVELVSTTGLKVETGRFQQHMLVEIHNDGPVTVLLDSKDSIHE